MIFQLFIVDENYKIGHLFQTHPVILCIQGNSKNYHAGISRVICICCTTKGVIRHYTPYKKDLERVIILFQGL